MPTSPSVLLRVLRPILLAAPIALSLAVPAPAQATFRASLSTSGAQANGDSGEPSISYGNRHVAFSSVATDLVAGDTNGVHDVFRRDRWTDTTIRISVSSAGVQANGPSRNPAISADGRYVSFESDATNLVASDTNGQTDVFVRDCLLSTTIRVSVGAGGVQGDSASYCDGRSISGDGRYVAFWGWATNLVPGDTNGNLDAFVRDIPNGFTVRVSVSTSGAQANHQSRAPAISADGRWVAFISYASNLVAGDANGTWDVYLRDWQAMTTSRVSAGTGGADSNGPSYDPSVSYLGTHVAFSSEASNLVPGDGNAVFDVFVRDVAAGTTVRASVGVGGAEGWGPSTSPSLSVLGQSVAFHSDTPFDAADTNGQADVYFRDLAAGTTTFVSRATTGALGNGGSVAPSVSNDGRWVAYHSSASTLGPGDTNGAVDVYWTDLRADNFTPFCDPGFSSVIPCPCANPPSGPGRGCDNSAATGGASLDASGVASLSIDTLVFTTAGEKPTATSIVLQGDAQVLDGAVYGQGVRCVGGSLKRLFTKNAVGGSITAPDFGGGDASVSATSAAKGDVILPGESRYYLVYYRDPIVLGGCSPTSTFNATHSGVVAWAP